MRQLDLAAAETVCSAYAERRDAPRGPRARTIPCQNVGSMSKCGMTESRNFGASRFSVFSLLGGCESARVSGSNLAAARDLSAWQSSESDQAHQRRRLLCKINKR